MKDGITQGKIKIVRAIHFWSDKKVEHDSWNKRRNHMMKIRGRKGDRITWVPIVGGYDCTVITGLCICFMNGWCLSLVSEQMFRGFVIQFFPRML